MELERREESDLDRTRALDEDALNAAIREGRALGQPDTVVIPSSPEAGSKARTAGIAIGVILPCLISIGILGYYYRYVLSTCVPYICRVSSRIFQLGGVQHHCHCAATHVTRGGRGGGGLCQYWLDWTSGQRQTCVTIHGCKIAYIHVHIQPAFDISVWLKISVSGGGGVIPPYHEGATPQSPPLEETLIW